MSLSIFSLRGTRYGLALCFMACGLSAQDLTTRAWDLEKRGEAAQAERLLRQSAANAPNDAPTQQAYAEFLERHRSSDARAAYEKLASALERSYGFEQIHSAHHIR